MKKKITFISIAIILLIAILSIFLNLNKKEDNKTLTKVKVAEVAHTVFYAPQYVALENGFFEEERDCIVNRNYFFIYFLEDLIVV